MGQGCGGACRAAGVGRSRPQEGRRRSGNVAGSKARGGWRWSWMGKEALTGRCFPSSTAREWTGSTPALRVSVRVAAPRSRMSGLTDSERAALLRPSWSSSRPGSRLEGLETPSLTGWGVGWETCVGPPRRTLDSEGSQDGRNVSIKKQDTALGPESDLSVQYGSEITLGRTHGRPRSQGRASSANLGGVCMQQSASGLGQISRSAHSRFGHVGRQ